MSKWRRPRRSGRRGSEEGILIAQRHVPLIVRARELEDGQHPRCRTKVESSYRYQSRKFLF